MASLPLSISFLAAAVRFIAWLPWFFSSVLIQRSFSIKGEKGNGKEIALYFLKNKNKCPHPLTLEGKEGANTETDRLVFPLSTQSQGPRRGHRNLFLKTGSSNKSHSCLLILPQAQPKRKLGRAQEGWKDPLLSLGSDTHMVACPIRHFP